MAHNAENIFAFKEITDEGEIGFDAADLVRGVEIWFYCQPFGERTVAMAAAVFNVSPKFLADALDECDNPFFFARAADDPGARLLDCDGL
ncbi:hypothetical protein [Roseicyclus amphidinii]|uniref:hypothetical protein n=1 Tax=Roseicyclus amphidinii TaxID=3034232 RepID=UPI0024E0BAD8|nr:hypothetical protein [Roseicyclus sp. Amp-Y-6]